ncbi:MAG: Fe(3+) ABC transporter substrate-binding protein [Gemmatimonadetes bacterium]|nr:Fe(3+) ABC transporter substrate-binding protein [Gemmatimonadota bacterium]
MSGLRLATAISLSALAVSACMGGDGDNTTQAVVNVYSHRHYEADQELFRYFTEMTGIQVNVQTASADELITRLETEGASTSVDVLITVDAGRLHRAKERGLLQSVSTATLDANVPSHLRDPDGFWYGLTQRGRVIVYATDRVDPSELSSYEDLADPRWKGRVLVRSSENIYNQSLLASIIAANGEEAAERWAEGIVANLARAPQGGDTDQIKDVAAGVGDVAIVNTYYLGRLLNADEAADRHLADKVGVFFPNQADRGTHVNVSGAGITAYSPNRENAIRLLEFLTETKAQSVFAEANFEYPVKPGIEWAATLSGWGEFVADTLNLSTLGALNAQAVMVFDRAGWR